MTENLKRKKGLTTYYNEFLKGATKGQRQNTNHLRYFKRLSILNHCSLFFTNKWAVERKVVICITKRKPYVISVEFLMWFPLFSPKAFFFFNGAFLCFKWLMLNLNLKFWFLTTSLPLSFMELKRLQRPHGISKGLSLSSNECFLLLRTWRNI